VEAPQARLRTYRWKTRSRAALVRATPALRGRLRRVGRNVGVDGRSENATVAVRVVLRLARVGGDGERVEIGQGRGVLLVHGGWQLAGV
jgi:hypothetical protein